MLTRGVVACSWNFSRMAAPPPPKIFLKIPPLEPVFFTLSGLDDDEECVIERVPTEFRTRSTPATVANHWIGFPFKGKPRGHHSHARLEDMTRILNQPPCWEMSWLKEPILNADTRVVAMMNARSGTAVVQGYEGTVAATEQAGLVLGTEQTRTMSMEPATQSV